MQDRFKFRVWHKEKNEFTEKIRSMYDTNLDIAIDLNGILLQVDYRLDENETDEIYNKHNFILMQCTGLKDKNGKLIYEGDIIKDLCTGYKYTVVWKKAGFVLKSEYGSYIGIDTLEQEVIGNLYKNPELLEEDING